MVKFRSSEPHGRFTYIIIPYIYVHGILLDVQPVHLDARHKARNYLCQETTVVFIVVYIEARLEQAIIVKG